MVLCIVACIIKTTVHINILAAVLPIVLLSYINYWHTICTIHCLPNNK